MIKKFEEFINESYLGGHRQPLYHFTRNLDTILKTDLLKMSKPARGTYGKTLSISVTRNVDYADAGDIFFELDYSKLYNDGYIAYPVDEWAWNRDGTVNKNTKKYSFGKSNFREIESGRRGIKHNISNLPKIGSLEIEFEERFYKNIENLGKYIISINGPELHYSSNIEKYLEKYPHIKIYSVDKNNHRIKKEITKDIKEKDPDENILAFLNNK